MQFCHGDNTCAINSVYALVLEQNPFPKFTLAKLDNPRLETVAPQICSCEVGLKNDGRAYKIAWILIQMGSAMI
jgi:hypothetical protein